MVVAPVKHYLRGILMGLAGLFPSVSAGTIALILGVHSRLVAAVASVNVGTPAALWKSLRGDAEARAAVGRVDLLFVVPIVAGMATAIFGGVAGVDWLLGAYPALLMALFVGLMMAGARVPWKQVPQVRPNTWAWGALGAAIAAGMAFLPPFASLGGGFGYVLAGFIAWSFMLLPGVSGSSMMVVLGLYEPLIAAAKDFAIGPLAAFAAGGVLGLAACSRFLQWLLRRHPGPAFAVLAGLIVGSLVRVWPWRTEPGFAAGVPAIPTWVASDWLFLLAAIVGAVIVLGLERLGPPAETAPAPEGANVTDANE